MEIQHRTKVNFVPNPLGSQSGLTAWFRSASKPAVAYGLLAFVAVGYSFGVSYVLSLANALPMPDPYLRIANATYFFWGTFFYAPVIVAAWLLASGVMYILIRAFGSEPGFEGLLLGSALATGLGTLATLVPDLVTSPLRALGVINEKSWETSVLQHGAWFFVLWTAMIVYVAVFVVTYPIAVRQATRLAWKKAVPIGVLGFVVFQGFEYIFIR